MTTVIEDTVMDETGQPVIVRIEVAQDRLETPEGYDRNTRGSPQIVERAGNAFKEALQLIHTCATQISTTIHTISSERQPKEFEVQFAVKIDGKVGAFIAESTAGAQLQITLRWGEKEQK